MAGRIASWRNVPEEAIVASRNLLPSGMGGRYGEAGRGAGRGCAATGLPVPEARAFTAQPVSRRSAPPDPSIQTAVRLHARYARI